jgi:hypothetical protein
MLKQRDPQNAKKARHSVPGLFAVKRETRQIV